MLIAFLCSSIMWILLVSAREKSPHTMVNGTFVRQGQFPVTVANTRLNKQTVGHQKSERIINGVLALQGQFPFAVAITMHKFAGEGAVNLGICGGTLLSTKWVLTAAHCIIDANVFTLYLGSTRLEKKSITLTATKFHMHPNYDDFTLENDVGLIRLPESIPTSDTIKPIDLMPTRSLLHSERVVALGWGRTGDATATSNALYYITIETMTNLECMNSFGGNVKENMVCVGGDEIKGICKGDSGGPLVQIRYDSKVILVGIACFVSHQGCEINTPSGFTRIYEYIEWISNVTRNTSSIGPTFDLNFVYVMELSLILNIIFSQYI